MTDIYDLSKKKIVICAEIGINHQGDLNTSLKLIDAAARCKVDAVKFQAFKSRALYAGEPEIPETLEIKDEWWPNLWQKAKDHGLYFGVSIFDEVSLEAIFKSGVKLDYVKVASGEIDDLPLIRKQIRLSDTFIVSTGGAQLDEIYTITEELKGLGKKVILLECTPMYPAFADKIHLGNIPFLRDTFDMPAGYSDHTIGNHFAIAAAGVGACFIEKHFALNESRAGIDLIHSANEGEMKSLIWAIREIEAGLKSDRKQEFDSQIDHAQILGRKSAVAIGDIEQGTELNVYNIGMKRPGNNIPARHINGLYRRKAREYIRAGSFITWEMVE